MRVMLTKRAIVTATRVLLPSHAQQPSNNQQVGRKVWADWNGWGKARRLIYTLRRGFGTNWRQCGANLQLFWDQVAKSDQATCSHTRTTQKSDNQQKGVSSNGPGGGYVGHVLTSLFFHIVPTNMAKRVYVVLW